MTAKVLMVQGSSSSAGKSLLVAALCRIYARRGVYVAPFKAQNMSNNAAVCPDGSEIGRAQALQAQAARLEPSVDMNPVLLKPEADARSQVVVMGRPWRTLRAADYHGKKDFLWGQVTAALDRLRATHELVIIEGAGSPAELNLKAGDIVNMAVARYAQSPVLLVGDIDRGGIFAQLLGTLWLLEPDERALVRGLVVNKFRGDPALFVDGVRILEEKGNVPILGVVPYLKDLYLPDEDAVSIEKTATSSARLPKGRRDDVSGQAEDLLPTAGVDIAVVRFPRIANFDDFDPLRAEPGVNVRYVSSLGEFGDPDAIILPGTKSTIADLAWLRQTGLAEAVLRHAQQGGAIAGVCGGYQILGENIRDPQHVESQEEAVPGLGLLPVSTDFLPQKATTQAQARIFGGAGWLASLAGQTVTGYEIHMGETVTRAPWLEITGNNQPTRPDGAASVDGCIWGCYLHGLFANDNVRRAWLASLGWGHTGATSHLRLLDQSLNRLADGFEAALDMHLLEKIIWES
jgi:adenosylcobyric acid synthase